MAWLSGWKYRVLMYFEGSDLSFNIPDTSIPITLSASCGKNNQDLTAIFDELGANSLKIAITFTDGTTQCYVEVEEWDNTNKKAFLHASIGGDRGDYQIYLYFDNTQSDNTSYVGVAGSAAAANVWWNHDVFHMNQDPSGGTGCIINSLSGHATEVGYNATPHGNMTSADLVSANFGHGIKFDGVDDYIEFETPALAASTVQETIGIFAVVSVESGWADGSHEKKIIFTNVNAGEERLSLSAETFDDEDPNINFKVRNAWDGNCINFLNWNSGDYEIEYDSFSPFYAYYNLHSPTILRAQGENFDGNADPNYYFCTNDLGTTWRIGGNAASNKFKGIISELRFYRQNKTSIGATIWRELAAVIAGYNDQLIIFSTPYEEGQTNVSLFKTTFNQNISELVLAYPTNKQNLDIIQNVPTYHFYKSAPIQRADAIFTQNDTNIAQIFVSETISFLLLLKTSTLFFIIESNFTSLFFNTEQISLPFHGTITDLKTSATKSRIDCIGSKGHIDITGFSSKIITKGT